MAPTGANRNLVEKSIGNNLGPFYGKQQAEEWKNELYRKEYEREHLMKGYEPDKYRQLYTAEERGQRRDRYIKHAEYERTVPGGYNELGPKEDKITVHASALSGSIHQHSPRFLETLVGTPAHKANKFTKGTKDLLLLGLKSVEPVKPDLHTTDLGYDPLLHKYRGKPPNHTALQKRTTRERTGYVAIAGGKKGSSEFGKQQSNMKDHMENVYARVPPKVEFLEDESASLQNKLKMVETKIGNGEQTKALLEYDQEPFPDKEKDSAVYLEKVKEQLSTYHDDRQKQLSINKKIMETNYRLVDPFTDHPYGVNYGRKGEQIKGYNNIMMRPNDLEEEYQLQMKEKAEYLKRVELGFQEQMKKESTWNLVTKCDKLTGEEHMIPHYVKQVSNKEKERIRVATENAKELTKIIQHHHAPIDRNWGQQFPRVGKHSETASPLYSRNQRRHYKKELAHEYHKLLERRHAKAIEKTVLSSGDLIFNRIAKENKVRGPESITPGKPSIFDPMIDANIKYPQKRAAPLRHKYYFKGQANPTQYIEYDSAQKVGGLLGDKPKEFVMPVPPQKRPLCPKVTPVKHRKICRVQSPPVANGNENISKFGVIVPSTRIEYDRRHLYNSFGDLGVKPHSKAFC